MVIDNLVSSLERLHDLKSTPADLFSIMEAYYHKTVKRLESVRDLIPLLINVIFVLMEGIAEIHSFIKRILGKRLRICSVIQASLL